MIHSLRMLLLACLSLTAVSAAAEKKSTAERLVELAEAIAKNNNVADRLVTDIRKDQHISLEDLMKVFCGRGRGGLGVGAQPGAFNSIEEMLKQFQDRLPTNEQLEAAADLERAGYLGVAVARSLPPHMEMLRHRNAKLFPQAIADFEKGARDFAEAARSKDPKKIQRAARSLHNACLHCHQLL